MPDHSPITPGTPIEQIMILPPAAPPSTSYVYVDWRGKATPIRFLSVAMRRSLDEAATTEH